MGIFKKTRSLVIFFGIFLSLVLYQPEGIGTIVAFGSLILVILACIFSRGSNITKFSVPIESIFLGLFLVYSVLNTILHYSVPGSLNKYIAQILLCIFLFNYTITDEEHKVIKGFFVVSSLIYVLEALRYCISNESTRFYHGDIMIFGAEFDPNFIGISFMLLSVFLVENICKKRWRLISIIGLCLTFLAVVFTASRGTFLAIVIADGLTLLYFIKSSEIKKPRKIIMVIIITLFAFLTVDYFSDNFAAQWDRISQFSSYDDNGRYRLWELSIELISQKPVFGFGMKAMNTIYGRASHNTFLQILVDNGIIGFLLFMPFLIKMAVKIYKYDKVFFIGLLALLVQIFFLDALDNRCVWGLLCWGALIPNKRQSLRSRGEVDVKLYTRTNKRIYE
jgi:hypothetical protein